MLVEFNHFHVMGHFMTPVCWAIVESKDPFAAIFLRKFESFSALRIGQLVVQNIDTPKAGDVYVALKYGTKPGSMDPKWIHYGSIMDPFKRHVSKAGFWP